MNLNPLSIFTSAWLTKLVSLTAPDQAHFVGSARWPFNTNHIWQTSVSSAWGSFPSDSDALTPVVEGIVSVSDKNVPIITIPNAKKGHYKVIATGARFMYLNATNQGGYRFHDGVNSWGGGRNYIDEGCIGSVTGSHTVTSDGKITLELQGYASSTGNAAINNTEINDFKISVYFYPTLEFKEIRYDYSKIRQTR